MLTSDWSAGVTATRTVRGERMSGTVLPSLVNMGLVNINMVMVKMVMVNMVLINMGLVIRSMVNMSMVNMGLVNKSMVNMVMVNMVMVNSGQMCGDIMGQLPAQVIISRLQAGGQRPEEVSQLLLEMVT